MTEAYHPWMTPSEEPGTPASGLAAARRLVAAGTIPPPSSWLLENADLLPGTGTALDVACGSGRNALFLAALGLRVRAVDRDEGALAALTDAASRLRLPVEARTVDLEADGVRLGEAEYTVIVVTHYLHRPLFPALRRALAAGGVIVYETFTVDQAALGRPRNPAFLLEHGELPRLLAPLRVLRQRAGEFEGRRVAGAVATTLS
jgi:SAM-dependent methyltransferase